MKIDINFDNKETIMSCSMCGYMHKIKHYDHPTLYEIDPGFGKEPFMKSENQFIYQNEYGFGPSKLIKKDVYACPKCGAIQVEFEI